MTDTIDRQIDRLLEEHAPEGTQWVVVTTDFAYGKAHGPFDTFALAHDWARENEPEGDVYPMFKP